MKAQNIAVNESLGRLICSSIYVASGKKLFGKGRRISAEDVVTLQLAGLSTVWVAELEAGDVGEDEAVVRVAQEICRDAVEMRLASGGRANLVTAESSCLLVDAALLRDINYLGSVVISTSPSFSFVGPGVRIATVKSLPFALRDRQLQAVLSLLNERGPLLQVRPIRNPAVGLLYTDPTNGENARTSFEHIVLERLERIGTAPSFALTAIEDEPVVAAALQHLFRSRPACVLIASVTAPAGPEDVIGRAMVRAGCHIERFLAPVEPGNLLLLGYKDEIPVLSAPGCFRSAKKNVLDMVLPPILARHRLSASDIAGLGPGGLLR